MERASALIGTATMICWTLVLGPIGAFLLASLAYAMVTGNFTLGLVCALAVLSPLFLSIVWGPVALLARAKRRERELEPSLRFLPVAE
jgi:hypothetical protein